MCSVSKIVNLYSNVILIMVSLDTFHRELISVLIVQLINVRNAVTSDIIVQPVKMETTLFQDHSIGKE